MVDKAISIPLKSAATSVPERPDAWVLGQKQVESPKASFKEIGVWVSKEGL